MQKKYLAPAALIIVFIMSVMGFGKLMFTNDFRAFFSKDNPELEKLEKFESTFSKQENILIILETEKDNVFSKDFLTRIRDLTNEAWKTPHSIRVNSIANFQHVDGTEDDINVNYVLPIDGVLNDSAVAELNSVVIDEVEKTDVLISAENGVAIIDIQLVLPEGDMFASVESVGFVRELVAQYQSDQVTIHLAGYATSNVSLGEAAALDVQTLIPLTYLLIIVGLLLWLRNISLVVSVLIVVTLSLILSIGLIGWVDPVLTPILGYVPSVIMIIAIADSMHILISFRQNINEQLSVIEAINKAIKDNFAPIVITSITTIIGFLALNFNDSPPYRQLGNIVAIGVAVAMLISLYLLPVLVKWFYKGKGTGPVLGQGALEKLNVFTSNNPLKILLLTVVILPVAGFLTVQNTFTDHWYHYFGEKFEIRKAIEVLNDKHFGVDLIEYQLSAKSGDIFDPDYVRDVDRFTQWMEKQPGVTVVSDYASIIKKLNKDMVADNSSYSVPNDRSYIAQLFLLYEMSLPFGLGTETLVSHQRESTRLTVYLTKTDAGKLLHLNDQAQRWTGENTPAIARVDATGLDMVMSDLNVRNINNMVLSTGVAFVLIALCMFVVLKSMSLGMVAIFTNTAPAVLTYATCYLLWGEIDLASSMVVCMSLGIIVDDTVHFLYKYKNANASSHAGAITYAFKTSGTAILITTLVLLSGFIVQGFSDFLPTAKVGILMACTFIYALIIDLLVLPCILHLLNAKKGSVAGGEMTQGEQVNA